MLNNLDCQIASRPQSSRSRAFRCERQIIPCIAGSCRCTHLTYQAMLTEIYIEALLVDEELADQVWEAGEIDD